MITTIKQLNNTDRNICSSVIEQSADLFILKKLKQKKFEGIENMYQILNDFRCFIRPDDNEQEDD